MWIKSFRHTIKKCKKQFVYTYNCIICEIISKINVTRGFIRIFASITNNNV